MPGLVQERKECDVGRRHFVPALGRDQGTLAEHPLYWRGGGGRGERGPGGPLAPLGFEGAQHMSYGKHLALPVRMCHTVRAHMYIVGIRSKALRHCRLNLPDLLHYKSLEGQQRLQISCRVSKGTPAMSACGGHADTPYRYVYSECTGTSS